MMAKLAPPPDKLDEARRFIEQHLHVLDQISNRLRLTLPHHVDVEDLRQDGVFGLYDAYSRFDPSRGIKFETFAWPRVRGWIIDEQRDQDFLSRSHRKFLERKGAIIAAFVVEHGRHPDSDEIAKIMEIDLGQYYRSETAVLWHTSYLPPPDLAEDKDPAKLVLDDVPDSEASLYRSRLIACLNKYAKKLGQRQRLILHCYYVESLTMKQIGKIIGVNESRVSQLHVRCLARLRKFMEAEGFTSFQAAA